MGISATRSTRIALVTNDVPVLRDEEVHWVASAVRDLGHHVDVLPWQGETDWAAYDLVVIRTPWDYFGHLRRFLAWTRHVEAVTRLVNPAAVVEWNSHKGYLAELGERGLRVLPALVVRPGDDAAAALAGCGWDELVVKAAVDGGGFKIRRGLASDPEVVTFTAALLAEGDVIVQPYAGAVEQGERSLVFLGGELSHAVRKVPAEGEFRSQRHHGGSELVHQPTAAEVELALAAMAAAPGELTYARADLIEVDGDPVLMELEVIEPDLFLRTAPDATARLAAVIADLA